MLIGQRWWQRNRKYVLWAVLVLGLAWFLRQTQGAVILEIYGLLSRPFEGEPSAVQEARLDNAQIKEFSQKIAELEQQNVILKQLLGYAQSHDTPFITAPIIGRSADAWWQQVILGRGSQEGIKKGYVVTGVGGLVGRVIDVTPHTSRVLLISDPSSQVGVNVTRSRSMGFIKGQGSSIAIMQFFEKVPDVRPGDTITTSRVSQLFPAEIPVGQVKSVNLNKGTVPEATIELTAPLNHLEWVLVQPHQAPF